MAEKVNIDDFGFEELVLKAPVSPVKTEEALTNVTLTPRVIDALAISGQKKLNMIRDELDLLFLERTHVIDDAMVALIVGQSVLLLGPPGTANLDI